ncbi:hypothetical protein Daus18300_002610 [Diaporthe australafricana]|uniref:Uncharacterized protein n=1 Tax=Diaporthe australafricana TaxID=127596 RepID=A0ABR3XMM8_9PEZI
MSDQAELRPHQRDLWNLLCRNYPADICKSLEDTDHVHNDVVHYLYSILQSARAKPASYLIARLASLPDTTANEMMDALAALNIHGPDLAGSASSEKPDKGKAPESAVPGSKPYFHSCERECFWLIVLELFKAGCLGPDTDGSAREKISDFQALHYLYRMDLEEQRSRRHEDVLWCVKRMWPLVEDELKSIEDMRQVVEDTDSGSDS